MKVLFRILSIAIILVLAINIGVFAAEGKVKATKLTPLKEGSFYKEYYLYDHLRHKYLEANEKLTLELFNLYSDGEVNEWQKYSEYKVQYYAKNGLLLQEEIIPFREDKESPILGELLIYNYIKGTKKVGSVDRYIIRKKVSEDGKKEKLLYFKLGYMTFNYEKDGSVSIDYSVLVKKEMGEKIKFEFVKYMRDSYLANGVLVARHLVKDINYKEGWPIVGRELAEASRYLVISPFWDKETVEDYTAQE